ncbi:MULTISPECIES: FKBP-type peptidyl-prolyl cis-trans isomerase [unclassified Providencia]|uniref:FKBP-type peptidyl-prolyl cis-trans isomerase n=1 Tax=unclassified Providencia TaxID=2633465 RepID=UPI000E9BA001|nr:FKBP-type peptidyl-prolyl cis-trans isomerase [Providencia sp.]MBP6082354.1 FKBP-type peptidyl-prolyl cis-trans isomerase [Providencia sp.]HBO24166.1 FKBP-type peptidyl-prolyl cis-trans isomerase [Providencia sp.]
MSTQIQAQSSVLLHFTLKLEDGSTADSSHAQGKPALFVLGNDSLSPELETQLLGLNEGEKKSFSLPGDAVFGKHNPDLVQYFSLRDFIETGIPEIGTIMLFSAMNGSEMPGVVKSIEGESITVDFNHPLAEQQISFDIEVLEVDPQLESQNANING